MLCIYLLCSTTLWKSIPILNKNVKDMIEVVLNEMETKSFDHRTKWVKPLEMKAYWNSAWSNSLADFGLDLSSDVPLVSHAHLRSFPWSCRLGGGRN